MINWFKKRNQASNMNQTSNLAAKKPAGARHSWSRAWVKVQDLAPGMKIAVPAASAVAPHMSGQNLELRNENLELRTWNLAPDDVPSSNNQALSSRDNQAPRSSDLQAPITNNQSPRSRDNDTEWDEIVSIKKVGEERVYDIEVDGTHNFIAGHLLNEATGDALTPEEENAVLQDEQPRHGLVYGGIFAHNTLLGHNVTVAGQVLPQTDSSYDLGSSALRWDALYVGSINAEGSIVPSADSTYDLGSSSVRWANIYADSIQPGNLNSNAIVYTNSSGQLDTNPYLSYSTTGNVGIGTTAPGAKLHIAEGSSFLQFGNVLGLPMAIVTDTGNVNIGDGVNVNGALTLIEAAAGASETVLKSDGTDSYIGAYNGGKFGIGTDAPSYILSLGGAEARTFGMNRNSSAATAGQGLTITSGGSRVGAADLAGGDLTLSGGISTGTGASAIHFLTATSGTTGTTDRTPTEKMTILGNGNVGIGTTTPGAQLDLSTDDARKLTTTTWATGSDSRIKTEIESINDALEIIRRVRPVKFHYTTEFLSAHPSVTDTDYYNFIAQEYQEVFPDSVTETDGTLFLNSSNMIPYAIAGIKAIDSKLADKADNSTLGLTIDQLLPTTDAFQETSTKLTVLESQLADYAASATTLDERLTALEQTSAPTGSDNPSPDDISSLAAYGLQFLAATDELRLSKDLVATQNIMLFGTLIADTAEIASALNIHGDATVWNNLVVKANLTVEGDLQVGGVLGVNSRQAGQAAIPRGGITVEVTYTEPFDETPLVQITPQTKVDTPYWISQQTETGFTISLTEPTEAGITFSWIAMPVDNVETTEGQPLDTDGDGIIDLDDPTPNDPSPTELPLEPVIEPTPTPSPSFSPSPTPVSATPTPTPEPISSTTPTPSPLPSPTASPTPSPTLTPSLTSTTPQGTITIQPTYLYDDFGTQILRVRISPDSSSQQVGTVTAGTSLSYYAISNGWYQLILDDGTIGWVPSQYVR